MQVNLEQSTNDVFPTAVRVAALRLLLPVIEDFANLQAALQEKEEEYAALLALGRTEMQDAVPLTVGQRFAAWAQAVQRDWWRLHVVEEKLRQVNLGGTAMGTGLNADRKYIYLVVDYLRQATGLNLARAENTIDLTQNADVFVEVSGLLKTAAVTLAKIAARPAPALLRPARRAFMSSTLPELQAGSSIMPGKVNPVIPEAITQVAYQVMANDLAITLAAQAGQLELNAFLPLIAHNLLAIARPAASRRRHLHHPLPRRPARQRRAQPALAGTQLRAGHRRGPLPRLPSRRRSRPRSRPTRHHRARPCCWNAASSPRKNWSRSPPPTN